MHHNIAIVGGSRAATQLRATVKVNEDPASARCIFNRRTILKHFQEDETSRAEAVEVLAGSPLKVWLNGGVDEMFLTIPIIKTAGFGGIPEEAIDRLNGK